MKKYLYLLLVPAFIWACDKETEPETPQDSGSQEPVAGKITLKTPGPFVMSDEGDSKTVEFDATLAWKAASSESWLTVDKTKGEAGSVSITITAGENPNYDPRSATITLTCDKDTKTIQVNQKQKGALLLTDSKISVSAEGEKITITAKANAKVTASIADEAKSWITDVTTKGLVDYVFEFEVAANDNETERSGGITFTNEYASETVTVEQDGAITQFNVYGSVTCDGAGVPGVLISDGIEIVKTDANGNYKLQSGKKWKYVFMITPSGYEPAALGFLPKIHEPLKADVETQEEVNFTLEKSQNDNYTLLVCGDIHLARRTGDLAQFEKVAGFMNEAIAQAPGKVYALTLGDMTWDMYWIANNYGFEDYIQTMNSYFPSTTFFHTMGNHDNEMEVGGDFDKALKYTENLTPDYYSFNLGQVHYIVMDNMDFTGVEPGQDNRSKYAKNFTAEQLEWLKKDLSYVDKSTPVFVTAHEPLARPSGLEWKEQLNGKDADLDTFIGLFDGYNVRFLSGHTHNIFNKTWTPTFVEHNSGAICASWWWSGYHTPGIHIAQDGAPGGFTVWDVKGTEFTHYYQAALQPREYQFRAYDMNKVKEVITADRSSAEGYPKYYNHIQSYGDNVILVNVWDYDEDWKVEISENGVPLNVTEVGVYDPLHIEAMTIPRFNKNSGTTTFSTAKWLHFFQATASAADTPVTVKVTDRYGNVFTEEMTRPKAFTVSEYKNEVVHTKPVAEFKYGSSSSLVFGWTTGCTAAEDAEVPYKLELFKDSACSDLQVSFDIPAEHSCWGGNALSFVFGGLQPATSYWFKVTNTQSGEVSDPVEGQTADFTVVDPTTVTDAEEGDVILAEDFSEVAWGPDEQHGAAGFFPSEKLLEPVTGSGEHAGTFVPYNSTGRRVYGDTRVTSDKRLYNWGFFGNSAVYAYNGHLRVCTTSSGARTHIVSPALSGIPEDKTATIDVTVTACPTYSDNDIAVFVNDRTALTLVLAPDQKEAEKFSSQGGKYTGASLTNGYVLNQPAKELTTSTVRIEGVTSNNCLIIGSAENVDTKNRFWLDDVKVQIVSLSGGDTGDYKSIKDEASFLEFVSQVAGGEKTLGAKVKSSFQVSATSAEAFASIEDYEGTFDGNGKTITGLTKPLFNNLKGTVKNLTLNSTLNITEDQADLGILANVVSGTVTDCTSQGSVLFNVASAVTGEHRIGGLIGSVAGSGAVVTDCINEASVTNATTNTTDGELIIGGVVGSFWGSEFHISGCENSGDVTNTAYWLKTPAIGGIVGQGGNSSDQSSDFTIASCSNSGAISNSGSSDNSIQIGGIAGYVRFAVMTSLSNSGAISNSGVAVSNVCIGGILGWVDKGCTMTQTKANNSGDVTNSGSGKLVSIGGILGRNSTGNIVATGTSSAYLQNNGTISDESSTNADDLSIGGIVGYTTTGIKLQYARNYGDVKVLNGTRDADVEIGGIAGWLSNNALNVNNCRNYGTITVSSTITGDLFAGGIVGLYHVSHTTDKYNLVFDATIDTHEATVSGQNYTAGLFGAHSGTGKATYLFNGLKFSGTVIGNKTKVGLLCNSRNAETTVTFKGSCIIAPGSSRQDNTNNDTVNADADLTMDIICGYLGSSSEVSGVEVAEW